MAIGLDVVYTWKVADKFQAGITTGYAHYMGKTESGFDLEDAGFIPLATTAQ